MPRMIFVTDKYVNDELFALAGKPVEVAPESVDRWIKRGGQVVEENESSSETVEVKLKRRDPPVDFPASRGPGRPKKLV